MSLFDAYIAVDWSASNVPKSGGDSIWISERNASGEACPSVNPRTRGEAMRLLERRISSALAKGERLLVGFDFPFGYPAGTAAPIAGTPVWSALWQVLEDKVSDDEHNRSNRFDVAGELNACLSQAGLLFWGHPANRSYAHLGPKRDAAAYDVISEKRLVETVAKTAQPVWKLAYTGSVGSQALLGIPRLNRLRRQFEGQVAVWPFETAFAKDLSRPVVLAEIYPSLVQIDRRIEPKDKAQVEAFTHYLWQADRTNGLAHLLSGPNGLTEGERQRVLSEEGWILGADISSRSTQSTIAAPSPVKAGSIHYLRDPAEIYRRSFATVSEEADLARFSDTDREVAMRMIHACGQVEIAENLIFSLNASENGIAALQAGKPIFCDSAMVAAGIIRSRLAVDNKVICTLDAAGVAEAAKRDGTTRSAAAVDVWDESLDGAIAVFGNAPTALFHLLERLDAGGPKPALIIGLPVGFVGAAESKAELIADSRDIPYLTLTGRLGGSAMASAAVNALAGLAWPKQ